MRRTKFPRVGTATYRPVGVERDVGREPEIGTRRSAAVAASPIAAGACDRRDHPVRGDGPDAVRREVGDEKAAVGRERDADRLLDRRLARRAAVSGRSRLTRTGEIDERLLGRVLGALGRAEDDVALR